VREQHDPIIADPIMEADLAFRRFGFEIRGDIAYLECHANLRPVGLIEDVWEIFSYITWR
jgi:hypothetical protein